MGHARRIVTFEWVTADGYFQLTMCPTFLGNGQSLLTSVSKTVRLDLLEAKALPSADVMLRYARLN